MRPCLLSLAAFSLTAFAVTFLPLATAGDLYKWTDEKGQVHYSSTPPPDSAKKAKTLDTKALSKINALPNDPSKDRADGSGPPDDSDTLEPETPAKAASRNESAPASPPSLIPASLLPPSNPPATANPEQPAQPEIVEVVAQGMGTDANAALLNAYSNAVQQALGLYVDAETMVQNDQIVRDKILTYSKGFIQEAKEISNNQANGLFQVNIRAKVKRQQLLEQAKANNITVKAVEGVSLHAQVESQIKQEKDAKALLEKALLPLMDTTFHRAELAPSTQDQPNPTINKEGTDDNFVTLDYKFYLWINEEDYLKYIKNNLIPILEQIATNKEDITVSYKNNREEIDKEIWSSYKRENKNNIFVLYWKDKGITFSKWKSYKIPKDYLSVLVPRTSQSILLPPSKSVFVELSLLDESKEEVALGSTEYYCVDNNSYGNSCSIVNSNINDTTGPSGYENILISPYFIKNNYLDQRTIEPPKSKYGTISVKINKQDLPRVKASKLEIKPAGKKSIF